MKTRRLIGIILILTALLLQVGYATTSTMGTVGTKEYRVKFEGNPKVTYDEYMKVFTEVEDGLVKVRTQNLYPGGRFTVISTIKNTGQKEAKIVDVAIEEIVTQGNSHELYEQLVGYKEDQLIGKDYNEYLSVLYEGKILKPNETMDIVIDMGLSADVTNLQNEKTEFNIRMQFVQGDVDTETGGGEGEDNQGGGSNPDIDKQDPGVDIDVEEEEIPGGAIGIDDSEKPNIEQQDIDVEEEEIPGGGMLPQTGGINPIIVYGIGIVLLGSGIVIYRKKK